MLEFYDQYNTYYPVNPLLSDKMRIVFVFNYIYDATLIFIEVVIWFHRMNPVCKVVTRKQKLLYTYSPGFLNLILWWNVVSAYWYCTYAHTGLDYQ